MRRRTLHVAVLAALLTGVVVAAPASAAAGEDVLHQEEVLSAGQLLSSADGGTQAVMQTDGNFVVYSRGAVRFSTGTFIPNSVLVEQSDGNAVIYTPGGQPVWFAGTAGRGGNALLLQNDGNLVEYAPGGPLWSSYTGVIAPPPPPPPPPPPSQGDTLASGTTLRAGQSLSSGAYAAVMQTDGNFVVYGSGRPLWSTGTGGRPNAELAMQTDGNLVLYSGGSPVWLSGTTFTNSKLVMQSDGNLVIYAPSRATWTRFAGRLPVPSVPGDGDFLVPQEVGYGTYRAAPSADGCYWETDDSAGNIVDNDFTYGQTIMRVVPGDVMVSTERCSTFFLID